VRSGAETLRRIGGALATGLLGLTVLALSALVLAQAMGYRSMIVRSGSMGGSIPVGSLVLTEGVPAAMVDVGDAAVVTPDGSTESRLHRVIEVEREDGQVRVATQGDANKVADSGWTTLGSRTQVPVLSVPLVGFALSGAGSRAGLLAAATVAAAILGWWSLRALWRTDAVASPS
jgi:signal peptidase